MPLDEPETPTNAPTTPQVGTSTNPWDGDAEKRTCPTGHPGQYYPVPAARQALWFPALAAYNADAATAFNDDAGIKNLAFKINEIKPCPEGSVYKTAHQIAIHCPQDNPANKKAWENYLKVAKAGAAQTGQGAKYNFAGSTPEHACQNLAAEEKKCPTPPGGWADWGVVGGGRADFYELNKWYRFKETVQWDAEEAKRLEATGLLLMKECKEGDAGTVFQFYVSCPGQLWEADGVLTSAGPSSLNMIA